MSIKHHASDAANSPGSPAWGVIAEPGDLAHAVRFELPDRSVSLPVPSIERWEFIPGKTDKLIIGAGSSVITVEGRGLARLRDGLDQGLLTVVRAKPAPAERAGTVVTNISIESR